MFDNSDIPPTPIVQQRMRLTDVSNERITAAGMSELYDLAVIAGIQDDERLVHCEDLRERLILMKRKMEGSSNKWKPLFQSVKEDTKVKSESLVELMKTVEATFHMCPVESLSEILRKEGHLQNRDLLHEISVRMKSLTERRSMVVVAGETNGGKSTFLNLLLGEDVLPTDVLHCTFVVCKLVYSERYSIKTVDHSDQVETFDCETREEVKKLLKDKVAQQEMNARAIGSPYKEITLGLPADILKSGVTLVDTPGIGEDENMDNVTMNFVKSTHASAFIYIIKSDTAGGIQEDRLLSFLRAIKERYSSDTEVEAFDPRAAMFVCHRWDNIEEHHREKVKKNALSKLEYVWPGFQPSQTFFFSTTDTMKHLPVDPDFVTDSFMTLLKGLKQLFERASHNAIKHQYLWLKYMLNPASHHLRSMITHCIHSNEELEIYFKSVAIKQNRLMISSTENSKKLQSDLNSLALELKEMIAKFLNFDQISIRSEIHDTEEIIDICSKEHFLYSKKNRHQLDEIITRCLLKYVDENIQERKLVNDMESKMLTAIQEHLGLFRSQISHIKNAMLNGGTFPLTPSPSRSNLSLDELGSQYAASTASRNSTASMNSTASDNSSVEAFRDETMLDTGQLASTIKTLLSRRKNGKFRRSVNSKHEFQESVLSKIKGKIVHGFLHKTDPAVYVEERMHKISKDIREDGDIMDSIVFEYTDWIQQCVNYATKSIPKFIDVNNKLMEEIREHRSNFQRDKDRLRKVMEELEPSRHHLRGYGILYMDDINTESLAFNLEHRNSEVFFPTPLTAEHKQNDDSGFQGSGSKHRQVKSLWARMQGATIKINKVSERVVVKTYIYDMDEKTILSEIASLRCLDYTSLASFLGMTRIVASDSTRGNSAETDVTEKISAFIFKGDLVSARVHSTKKMTNMQLFVPDLIHSLLQGLNYIHREDLVHMELNLDTVMVERVSGAVKLCQMCKPREARFPTNLGTITRSCVCLSPNVLQGHEYESTDDIYAFGLLLWELLFPDEPPYKEQRAWPLRRFIEECHPVNMLQESLMRLKVSENVHEVLKGTLLVSRRTICMPIATVQSLLELISEEPAVQSMRSRHEPFVIKHKIHGHRSGTHSPPQSSEVSLAEDSPKRPPRRKDKVKESDSIEEPEIDFDVKIFSRRGRRQSEPVVPIHSQSSSSGKTKRKLSKIFGGIFGRGSTKKLSDEESEGHDDDVIDSADRGRKVRSLSIVDDMNNDQGQLKDLKFSSPQLKPKSQSRKYAPVTSSASSKPNSRRLSLQDQSLFGPRKVTVKREESIDVPSLMSRRFSTNMNNTLPRDNLQLNSYLSGSMSSVSFSSGSTKSAITDYYRNQSQPVKLPSEAQKSSQNFTFLKSKSINESQPRDVSRQLDLKPGKSLQDISGNSLRHSLHRIGPIMEDKVDTINFQYGHDSHEILNGRLGRSLQDISIGTRALEPAIENKIDSSNLNYMHARNYFTGLTDTKSSDTKSHKHHRISAPSLLGHSGKSLAPASFRHHNAAEEKFDNFYSQVISSSLSHLRAGEETNHRAALGLSGGSNTDLSSDSQELSMFPVNSNDTVSLGSNIIPIVHKKSYSYPEEALKIQSESDKLKLAVTPGNTTKRESQTKVIKNTSQRTVCFSIGETNEHFRFADQESFETPDEPIINLAPPPPPINFSKLTFGATADESDDDEGFPFN